MSMRNTGKRFGGGVATLAWMLFLCLIAGLSRAETREDSLRHDRLFQTSLIDALLAGEYSGVMTVGNLRRHGDFGLGTFHRLDGEMVVLDGVVYQVSADGRVRIALDHETTPFAAVAFFDPDRDLELSGVTSLEALGQSLDGRLPSLNWFYALRIEATVDSITVRSVPPQDPPYPVLAEVVGHQSVWTRREVRGTLVGLRCPAFVKGINVPGYHWHFISEERDFGGHVLDVTLNRFTVAVDRIPDWSVTLPDTTGFGDLDLERDRAVALDRVEKQRGR